MCKPLAEIILTNIMLFLACKFGQKHHKHKESKQQIITLSLICIFLTEVIGFLSINRKDESDYHLSSRREDALTKTDFTFTCTF